MFRQHPQVTHSAIDLMINLMIQVEENDEWYLRLDNAYDLDPVSTLNGEGRFYIEK